MLPWEEVVRGRGASFDSLRNIFLHVVDVEDRVINYVIPGRAKEWVSRPPEEFHDVGSIKKRVLEVEGKTNAYLAKLTPDELEKRIEFPMWGKPPVSVRVEDVLLQVVLESIHHFGELIALLWQMDVVPPHMGWINYAQDKAAP